MTDNEKELFSLKKELEYVAKNINKVENDFKKELADVENKIYNRIDLVETHLKKVENKIDDNFKDVIEKLDNLNKTKYFFNGIIRATFIVTPILITVMVALFKSNGLDLNI